MGVDEDEDVGNGLGEGEGRFEEGPGAGVRVDDNGEEGGGGIWACWLGRIVRELSLTGDRHTVCAGFVVF